VHRVVVMHCWEDDRVLLAYQCVLGSIDQVNHQNSGWSNHHLTRVALMIATVAFVIQMIFVEVTVIVIAG
jgi:hypothetical protein